VRRVLRVLCTARHGRTAWSLMRQHTALTDVPLTETGERIARRLGERVKRCASPECFRGPLQRVSRTYERSARSALVADSTPILSSGTVENMRAAAQRRSSSSVRSGNSSGTVAPTVNRRNRPWRGRPQYGTRSRRSGRMRSGHYITMEFLISPSHCCRNLKSRVSLAYFSGSSRRVAFCPIIGGILRS
jgi:hypothetical protein